MICFCDIPISRTSKHRYKYGSYGIGFNKRRLLRQYGKYLNPVNYIISSKQLEILNDLRKLTNINITTPDGKANESLNMVRKCDNASHNNISTCLGYMKPYSNNEISVKDYYEFYQESEWRIVIPEDTVFDTGNNYSWLWNEADCDNWKKSFSKVTESNLPIMTFNLDDVEYIFLENKKEIEPFIQYLYTLESFGGNVIKTKEKDFIISRTISKIRTFEALEKDY